MRAPAYLEQIRSTYRAGGVRLVARKLASRFRCEVLLYAYDLERELPEVESGLVLDLRPLTQDDVDAYVALRRDEHASTVRRRLRRGDLCMASWSGGRIVGAVWARFDRMWVSELGRSMSLEPGEVYGYASFIEPAHRRRRAASVLYLMTMQHLKGEGHRRVLGYVDKQNLAGRAPLWKLGFQYVGRVRWLHAGRFGVELKSEGEGRPRLRAHVRSPRVHE